MELSTSSQQLDNYLQDYLQNLLKDRVEEKYLKEFAISLFPFSKENTNKSLLENMSTYYGIRMSRNAPFDEITKELYKKSEEIGHGLPELIKKLFQSEFRDKFMSKVTNTQQNASSNMIDLSAPAGKEHKEQRKASDVVLVHSKPKDSHKTTRTQTGSAKSNNSRQNRQIRQPQGSSPQINYVNNLSDRGVCLCEKVVGNNQKSFRCIHCHHNFHLQCMKKSKENYCSMCHLKRMLPNKEVKKVLFVGVLKKSKKRHEFTIYLSDEDLTMKYKLQIRSIRLKEGIQNFMQFPDYTNIVLNNNSVKEYLPLHRQSSLHYRKDQPYMTELKHLEPKENKVVIHEKLPSKDSKEERIDTENHLIGFFMVEERKIQPLAKEISLTAITTLDESKSILEKKFVGDGKGSEDLSCEVVKIPLLCTISTERIKIPARGIFCTHPQCFDLYNYMIVTSASVNPKWICPICKMPCYEFRVDCILQAILSVYAEEKGTEVMFFKSWEFSVHAGDKHIEGKINNINDLPIEKSIKRPLDLPAEPEKKKKKNPVIPDNNNVIDLD